MKKTALLTFALFIFIFSYSQEDISLDQMLVNVDKSSVTSGIIYERVPAFANLYKYNQTRDTADVVYFEQALNEFYNASNKTKFISNAALRLLYAPKSQANIVDIGILNSQYQYLNYNSDNESLGGLTLSNNLFSQINGKPPFNSSSVVVIAPTKDNVVGSSITYNFKSNLWFTNGTKTIKKVTAVLGDGVSRGVIVNGSIALPTVTITYSQSGYKYLKFTVTFSDNSTHVTYGKLYAKVASQRIEGVTGYTTEDFTLTASVPFQGYNETTSTYAQIQYRIFYSTTQKKLMKPIIISDGFDPGDKRKIQASDYINYVQGKDFSIEDMMGYTDCDGITQKNLILVLNAKGYDVVIVNYFTYTSTTTGKEIDGGADFIERNALAMVALIQKLNTTLAANGSTQQLVVVGPSMGGQITRYALAYMEKQYAATNDPKWLHKTRLWVSIDSPHLGANIPEGLQSLVSLLKEDSPSAADFYYKQLHSAAAEQQLINLHQDGSSYNNVNTSYLNGRTISQGFTTNSGSPFYQQYYNNLFNNGLTNSKGYPMNLRKIALVNGSVTGKTYGTNNQQTLNIRGFTNICFIWCWDIHVASFETYTLPAYGSDQNIARFKKSFTDRHTHMLNNDSRGNVDILPGGWFPGYQILDESIMGQSQGTDYTVHYTVFFPFFIGLSQRDVFFEQRTNSVMHSFIPSFSALGMKNPNQNWAQSLKRNLVCGNEIPFDSYFGHDDNTQHTSFDCESVNWLLKELDGIPQSPWFPLQSTDISGPSTLCTSTGTYSFSSLCSIPSGATWTWSSNLERVSSSPTSITVQKISDGPGAVTATFSNGYSVTKDISVGNPFPTGVTSATSNSTSYNGPLQSGFTFIMHKGETGSAAYNVTDSRYSSLTWTQVSAQTGTSWSSNGRLLSETVTAPQTQYTQASVTVRLNAQGPCGPYTQDFTTTAVNIYSSFTMSPNPAQNSITLSTINKDQKNNLGNIYAIKITDRFGVVRKSLEYKQGITTTKISLSDLNSGAYLVSIFDGHRWTSKPLLVQK